MNRQTPETARAQWSRVGAADHIASDMRNQIMTGTLSNGDRVPPEKELATAYGVSVNTIREAIRALAALGLVEVKHGRGTYVTGLPDGLVSRLFATVFEADQIQLESVLQLGRALLTRAAQLGAERASDTEIDSLERLLEQVETAPTAAEVASGVQRFRDELVALGHDPLLTRLYRFVTRLVFGMTATLIDDAFWTDDVRQLQELRFPIVAALRARDVAAVTSCVDAYNDAIDRLVFSRPQLEDVRLYDTRWASLLNGLAAGDGDAAAAPRSHATS